MGNIESWCKLSFGIQITLQNYAVVVALWKYQCWNWGTLLTYTNFLSGACQGHQKHSVFKGSSHRGTSPARRAQDDLNLPLMTNCTLWQMRLSTVSTRCYEKTQMSVFTKYSVTIICSACTAEHKNIEEWDERPFDKVPSVNVSEARRAANPIELYSRFISEELRYHVILSPCPHILMSSCHHVIVTYFTYKDDHFYIT